MAYNPEDNVVLVTLRELHDSGAISDTAFAELYRGVSTLVRTIDKHNEEASENYQAQKW